MHASGQCRNNNVALQLQNHHQLPAKRFRILELALQVAITVDLTTVQIMPAMVRCQGPRHPMTVPVAKPQQDQGTSFLTAPPSSSGLDPSAVLHWPAAVGCAVPEDTSKVQSEACRNTGATSLHIGLLSGNEEHQEERCTANDEAASSQPLLCPRHITHSALSSVCSAMRSCGSTAALSASCTT